MVAVVVAAVVAAFVTMLDIEEMKEKKHESIYKTRKTCNSYCRVLMKEKDMKVSIKREKLATVIVRFLCVRQKKREMN